MTIQECQDKLNKRFPEDNCKILQYTIMKEPAEIQCLNCGKKYFYKKAENIFIRTKKHACTKCFPIKEGCREKTFNKFIDYLNTQDLFEPITLQELKSTTKYVQDLVELKCKKCGKINKKSINDYMRGRGCTCSCTNTLKTTEEFKNQLPEDIEILDKYKGAFEKSLFRHKTCGFCWQAKPHNILCGKGCPKCNRKTSKGEQKIMKYLKEHNIDFIHEYPIEVEGHKLRIDFFFPQYNFGIEYNGIQHYEPVKHFGGIEKLLKQQEMDRLKNKYYNIKTISYEDFDNIESILTLVFNDYPEGEQGQASRKNNL